MTTNVTINPAARWATSGTEYPALVVIEPHPYNDVPGQHACMFFSVQGGRCGRQESDPLHHEPVETDICGALVSRPHPTRCGLPLEYLMPGEKGNRYEGWHHATPPAGTPASFLADHGAVPKSWLS